MWQSLMLTASILKSSYMQQRELHPLIYSSSVKNESLLSTDEIEGSKQALWKQNLKTGNNTEQQWNQKSEKMDGQGEKTEKIC